jgi:hypothetical protein
VAIGADPEVPADLPREISEPQQEVSAWNSRVVFMSPGAANRSFAAMM